MTTPESEPLHRRWIEPNATLMTALATLLVAIGGLVEIAPMFAGAASDASAGIAPYTPLELAGRDVYIREGCSVCHSQMVRPLRSETLRYGPWSRADEYQWDRPFLLGSRRIGPDLQRVGGKYPDAWHWEHLRDPRSTSPGSVMPTYGWLARGRLDPADVTASVVAQRRVGTPYTDEDVAGVPEALHQQGQAIVDRLLPAGIQAAPDSEAVAVIAYLQRLGVDGRAELAQAEGGAP